MLTNAYYAVSHPVENAGKVLNLCVFGGANTPCNTVGQIASLIAVIASCLWALTRNSPHVVIKCVVLGFTMSCFVAMTALKRVSEDNASLLNEVQKHQTELKTATTAVAEKITVVEETTEKFSRTFEEHLRDLDTFLSTLEAQNLEEAQVGAICQVIETALEKIPIERHAAIASRLKSEANQLEEQAVKASGLIETLVKERKMCSDAFAGLEAHRDSLRAFANDLMGLVRMLAQLPKSEIRDYVMDRLTDYNSHIRFSK